MKNNIRALLVVVFMLFASSVFAAEEPLQVKCVDSSGAPLEGAKVTIVCLNCKITPGDELKSDDEKSDSEGFASFRKLENAVYRVFGRKNGFSPVLYEYVDFQSSPQSIQLEFQEGKDRKLYFEDMSLIETTTKMQEEGLALYRSGKAPEAEKILEQAVALSPSNLDIYYDLANIYLSQGKFDQGQELLDKLSHLSSILIKTYNPYVPSGYYKEMVDKTAELLSRLPILKADNAFKENKYDVAAEGFRKAVENNPKDVKLHVNLAAALANAKKYDEALQTIEKASRMAPGETPLEDLKNQIVTAKASAELEKVQAALNEGDALLKNGDFENALIKFQGSLSMVPENARAPILGRIGLIQLRLNKSDEAVESFKKAIELSPAEKRGDYIKPLFQHYVNKEKYEEALSLLID
ncbi:MAG: tetratricopeptide repeat protein, partial [Desulfobacteraceae bacterium]